MAAVTMPSLDDFQPLLTHLRSFSQQDLQGGWRYSFEDWAVEVGARSATWTDWEPASLNVKGQVAWEKGRRVLWLGQVVRVPEQLNGYPTLGLLLRLYLTWWADLGQVFVNGELVQEGDLYDSVCRWVLTPQGQGGECFEVALRFVSPNHDIGALMLSQLRFEAVDAEVPEPGFVADELAVLGRYFQAFRPEGLGVLEGRWRSCGGWGCGGGRS